MRKSSKKTLVVSAGTLAAHRAHRTRLAKEMVGASRVVRAELVAKLAAFDAKLAAMKVAA